MLNSTRLFFDWKSFTNAHTRTKKNEKKLNVNQRLHLNRWYCPRHLHCTNNLHWQLQRLVETILILRAIRSTVLPFSWNSRQGGNECSRLQKSGFHAEQSGERNVEANHRLRSSNRLAPTELAAFFRCQMLRDTPVTVFPFKECRPFYQDRN